MAFDLEAGLDDKTTKTRNCLGEMECQTTQSLSLVLPFPVSVMFKIVFFRLDFI